MFKKLICCISALALLFSAVVPAAVLSANATEYQAASGSNLLYSFDDVTDLSSQKWKPRWDNGGEALQMTLETAAANVYGGSGKSLKITYDNSKKESAGPPTIWVGDTAITTKGDGITFWIKSEKATKIRIVAADVGWKTLTIDNVEIKAGENLLFFKYSEFNNYASADVSKLKQFQIRTAGNDANTFYFDNFGFFSESGEQEEDWTKNLKAATGSNLLYSFDDVNDLSSQKWKPRWDNGGEAMELALETSSANVYGGSGKSLKVTYDNAKKESAGPPTVWVGDTAIIPKGDGITFWIKSEKATTIRIVVADKSWKTLTIDDIEIKTGENLLFFRYSDFSNYASADMSKLNQFQIRTANNDANTFYLDNFGFFDLPEQEEDKTETTNLLDGTLEVLWDFDKYTTVESMNGAWQPHLAGATGEGIKLAIESGTENVYGGSGKSLKVEYDRTKGTDTLPCIRHMSNLTTKGEGLIFWLKSAEDTKIYFVGVDKNNLTVKTNPIDIKQGENVVVIKYSDIFATSGSVDLSVLKQMQIRPAGSNKTGTYWLDSFGFYATPAVHEADFFEFDIDGSKWSKNSSSQAVYTFEKNSEHYHSGITDVKDNKTALKVSYKNLSTSNTNSIYYNSSIKISDQSPYIYGEDSVLSFWIYSEQEVKLNVLYTDKNAENKDVMSATKELTVPAGESIFRIPMKELVKSGTEPIYKQVYQLQFRFFASSGTTNASKGNVWIDAIGFYDSVPDSNVGAQLLDKAFVWWDFDDDTSVDNCGWLPRWAGDNGKGLSLSLDSDPANTYGGSGQSLKAVYKTAESDNGQPTIWLGDKRMAMYGDGITFWLKSENQTKIRLVGIDADGNTVVTDHIPVKIGENIITVTWDDFYVSGNTDTPCNMASVSQLQIRAAIKDSNTYWVDSIGFYNVTDDGSNAYYSINPPESYDDWYEGVSVVGDDFESYPGDDDMKFCVEWYFDSNGWIALENQAGNTKFRMDYDFTTEANSILTNISKYEDVDPNGGISFWAKSSVERYYTLKVWMGESTVAVVVFKATPEGRYYKIPFSAFWISNKINQNYTPASNGTINVPKITIVSDDSCNPPAIGGADKFSLWLDDIKFVDSATYKRAGAVDHYENGVRLKADGEAFTSGVYPSIDVLDVTDAEKKTYLKSMNGSNVFGKLYQIDAFDAYGVSLVPTKAVDLYFDVPAGISSNEVYVYQLFIDGSMSKRSVTVTEDGKVKASVYRLGKYVVGYGNGTASNDTVSSLPAMGDKNGNLVTVLTVILAMSALVAVYIGLYLGRKEHHSNEK